MCVVKVLLRRQEKNLDRPAKWESGRENSVVGMHLRGHGDISVKKGRRA